MNTHKTVKFNLAKTTKERIAYAMAASDRLEELQKQQIHFEAFRNQHFKYKNAAHFYKLLAASFFLQHLNCYFGRSLYFGYPIISKVLNRYPEKTDIVKTRQKETKKMTDLEKFLTPPCLHE